MKKVLPLLITLLISAQCVSAQTVTPFKRGDKITFVGNSITDGGHYHSFIWLYYMTRFPNERITIYNCGIGGDTAGDIYKRLDGDIFCHQPNVLTLTFGMNDSGYFEYNGDNPQAFADKRVKESFDNYKLIEKRLKALPDTRIVLIGSSPYDETAVIENNTPFKDKNKAMLRIVDFQKESARENNWEFLDYNQPMTELNQLNQQKDPTFALCGNDRIHPDNDGHMVMAYLFLKAQGFSGKEVADVAINAGKKLLSDEIMQASEASMVQLRGYRALYYYILFDLFRNIPLDTTYDHPAGWMPDQADPQQTWDFIISELTDLKGKCGEDNGMGKINDYTVNMILAKMYLNHNAWFNDFTDDSWYGKAIDEINEIINSSRYALAANYSDCFKEDISGCPEIIFGIPFENKYASGNYYANKWIHVAGRAVWDFNGWATGGSTVLPQFLDTYDEEDGRFTDCWTLGQQYNRSGAPITVDGEPLIYSKEIHSIDNPGCYPFEGGRLIKYEILSGDFGTAYDDIPFFRLADAYMIKAECLLRLGGYKGETEQHAADLVTAVRRRAFKTNPAKAVRTVEQLKGGSVYEYGYRENQGKMGDEDNWVTTYEGGDDIELGGLLDDLAWEFVAEHHRRQDLIRFRIKGKNQNVYNGKSWFCKRAKTDPTDNHCDIFPIPKDFMDGNMKLKQNPGYGGAE